MTVDSRRHDSVMRYPPQSVRKLIDGNEDQHPDALFIRERYVMSNTNENMDF